MPPRGFSIVTLCAAMIMMSATPVLAGGDDLVIEGSGWGHGVGLSNYGSYARALAGQTDTQIIEAYYPGATDAPMGSNPFGEGTIPTAPDFFVNVGSDFPTVDVRIIHRAGGADAGVEMSRPGGDLLVITPTVGTTPRVRITDHDVRADGGCTVAISPTGNVIDLTEVWSEGSCDISFPLYGDGPADNLVELVGCRPQPSGPCTYGLGTQAMLVDNFSSQRHANGIDNFDGFDLIVQVSAEQYTMGINEVPFSWGIGGMEALKAQATVSRSFGASKATTIDHAKQKCFCDLKNTPATDQNYDGFISDNAQFFRWEDAVQQTTGLVISHPDKSIIAGYFGSSNGGRTTSNQDHWPGIPIPWLQSVDDPYSLDPASGNPYIHWPGPPVVSKSVLANALGLQEIYDLKIVDTYSSGAPSRIEVTGRDSTGTVVIDQYAPGKYIDGKFVSQLYGASQGIRSSYITGFSGDLPGPPAVTDTSRWAGDNRYETAIEISKANFPAGAETVIVATGLNFPDALAAASLADGLGAPVLLIPGGSVPGSVFAEISRLGPSEIVILGGTAAVPMSAENTLDDIAPVSRLAGANRYETATRISKATHPGTSHIVYVAPGTTYPEPLAAGAAAASDDAPILLVPPTSLPGSVANEITRLNPSVVVVVGGGTVISQSVVDAIAALVPTVETIDGSNRYTMSANVSAKAFPSGSDSVLIATGNNFPDALAGSGVAGLLDAPILLVGSSLPSVIAVELQRLNPDTVHVLGGPSAVPQSVYDAIVDLLD